MKLIERMHFSITEHFWAFHLALIDTLYLAVSPANMVFFSLVEICSLGLIQRQQKKRSELWARALEIFGQNPLFSTSGCSRGFEVRG